MYYRAAVQQFGRRRVASIRLKVDAGSTRHFLVSGKVSTLDGEERKQEREGERERERGERTIERCMYVLHIQRNRVTIMQKQQPSVF